MKLEQESLITQSLPRRVSKQFYDCARCEKWNCVSVKNKKRHAAIHLPEEFKECSKHKKKV